MAKRNKYYLWFLFKKNGLEEVVVGCVDV